jgi:hypothetical protein
MKNIIAFLSADSIKIEKLSVFSIFLILFSAVNFNAQAFEKGKISDLKGLTKLYINVGTDTERRNIIVNEIEKAKIPGLAIVESRDEAEIFMRFGGKETEVLEGVSTNVILNTDWTMTTVDRRKIRSGQGLIFIAGKGQKRPLLVMTFNSVQDSVFENRPSMQFAEKFVRAYKEANGIK